MESWALWCVDAVSAQVFRQFLPIVHCIMNGEKLSDVIGPLP